jgi:hypothetical protein
MLFRKRVVARCVLFSVFACAVAGLAGGCAKVPAGSQSGVGPQLTITMTVAGAINPNDYYYVVFNNANDPNGTNGPVPVVASPWSNGFVAPNNPNAVCATSFVEYNGSLPGDGYELYSFIPGTSPPLVQYSAIGAPTQDTPVTTGSNTLEFQIPLSQLQTSTVPAGSINYLQLNFINTNLLPVNAGSTLTTPKLFDALGNPAAGQLNHYITISTAQSGTFNNSTLGSIEPQGDVYATQGAGSLTPSSDPDAPNLDIVNWSVQITN